jgi:hypothetical protein
MDNPLGSRCGLAVTSSLVQILTIADPRLLLEHQSREAGRPVVGAVVGENEPEHRLRPGT